MLNMSGEDLERLYSPSQWSKRYNSKEVQKKHIQFLEEHSKIVRETIPCQLGVVYGPGPREKYDIYGTDLKEDSPILIHIHGGYYQEPSITHSNNGFISNVLHQNGIKTILLGYELCPGRTLNEVLEHLQIGLRQCMQYAKAMKSRGVYLSGHSAGAHAVATLLARFGDDAELIKGSFLLCGLYDFVPLTKVSVNDSLDLTEECARAEFSPLFDKLGYGNTAIRVVGAENDSPAFVRQSEEFYGKLRAEGVEAYLHVVGGVDHFDVVERLYYADFELTKIIVNAINKGV